MARIISLLINNPQKLEAQLKSYKKYYQNNILKIYFEFVGKPFTNQGKRSYVFYSPKMVKANTINELQNVLPNWTKRTQFQF